ncbi:hypothetical protein HV170_08045 [Citrobacter freundii]|uniref:hypothetical protein n=1 Tax=Citrobacter freundii TaxID=546 RepID=UPI0015F47845|nr:hypothetical protein [Citrobacter freundii]
MKNFQLMPAKRPGRLAIIPGLLLASTGLLVPVDAIAEERLCERESATLCAENKGRALLTAQPYIPANTTSDAIINNGVYVVLSKTENTDAV